MLLHVAVVAAILLFGNIVFHRFEPRMPLWRRLLKSLVTLSATAVISYYFGRTGVIIAGAMTLVPLIYVHAIWLPRHGVNGWTAEPRDTYYALRGWRSSDQ